MGTTPSLSFVRREAEDVVILDLTGDLVLGAQTHLLREDLYRELEAGHRKILLNMASVRFMDSTGVGLLVSAKTSAIHRNAQLKLCGVSPPGAQLLARLQLTKILEVCDQEPQALESFR